MTSYAYEPNGKVTSIGASSNPFQYTGRENDGTGLYYYRARYYDPSVGRFIQEDPIGLAGGLNFYNYVDGNPINRIDPTGLYGTIDFVWNYCFGNPDPVDLSMVGLLDAFRNAVAGATTAFKVMVKEEAISAAGGLCDECDIGTKTTSFSLGSTIVTSLRGRWGPFGNPLYSIGDSSFRRTANCSIQANCSAGTYSYSCNLAFGLQDAFADPTGYGFEVPGCTPYPIRATWFDNISGSGNF